MVHEEDLHQTEKAVRKRTTKIERTIKVSKMNAEHGSVSSRTVGSVGNEASAGDDT